MARTVGSAACLLGKTWGYDDAGVWVLDGCSAEFVVTGPQPQTSAVASNAILVTEPATAPAAPAPVVVTQTEKLPTDPDSDTTAATAATSTTSAPNETWGVYDPGKGYLIGKSDKGELSISAYTVVRYMNQMDDNKEFTDHMGND